MFHVGSVSSIASPSSSALMLDIHHSPQIASLVAEEAPTKVTNKYVDFAFSSDLVLNSSSALESMIMLSSRSMVSNHLMGLSIA